MSLALGSVTFPRTDGWLHSQAPCPLCQHDGWELPGIRICSWEHCSEAVLGAACLLPHRGWVWQPWPSDHRSRPQTPGGRHLTDTNPLPKSSLFPRSQSLTEEPTETGAQTPPAERVPLQHGTT